jgi:hypothetical protein
MFVELLPPSVNAGRTDTRIAVRSVAAVVQGGVMQPPRRVSGRTFRCALLASLIGASLGVAGVAHAEQDIQEPDLSARPTRTGPVNLLPDAVAARVNDDRVTATTWAGYDGGKRSPLVTATVEARIIGRLVFVAGAGYTANVPGSPAFRPQVGLRLQFLDQSRAGIDAAVAVMYRQDQFTEEGGFYQGAIAVQREMGRLLLVANVLYGQDGEGDDRYGEARLAPMVDLRHGFRAGLDARYRHDLWSDDPRGASRDRPLSELVAAPTASYTHGSWVVMAEAGFSSVSMPATQNGVIALGGVGACF